MVIDDLIQNEGQLILTPLRDKMLIEIASGIRDIVIILEEIKYELGCLRIDYQHNNERS